MTDPAEEPAILTSPSRLYRAEVWQFGLFIVRWLPGGILRATAAALAGFSWHFDRPRRNVVIENLRPVVSGDDRAVRECARRLYRNFAMKVVDLWRYEAGLEIRPLFGPLEGKDRFLAAVQGGPGGVLLVTPHLGNWEFGAPLIALQGYPLLAITLAEPHAPLTNLRQRSRARYGIETLVIQQDPFAFLEVIRRLQEGQIVALLVDRPPPAVAVPVEFLGRTIDASSAPVELARATGCRILPVSVLRTGSGQYRASVYPEIPYHRAALRSPGARGELAGAILRAFETCLRQHPDQWYHFVPIWRENPPPGQDVS